MFILLICLNNEANLMFWYIFFSIIGLIIILILIFGYPRKKNERIPCIEGLDDPGVTKAFEKMTKFLPFKMLYRKILSKLKKFQPNGLLVDIGCGSGNLIVRIAEKFQNLELFGVDISEDIIQLAKQRALDKSVDEKIEFKIGTAESLPFSDHSVDFIISTLSLHHWSDPLKVIEELHRVLKNNGTLLIFDFRRDARKFFYGLFTFATKIVVPKALKKINEPLGSISASYTPDEVNEIFSQTTFQNIEIHPYLAWMFINGKK